MRCTSSVRSRSSPDWSSPSRRASAACWWLPGWAASSSACCWSAATATSPCATSACCSARLPWPAWPARSRAARRIPRTATDDPFPTWAAGPSGGRPSYFLARRGPGGLEAIVVERKARAAPDGLGGGRRPERHVAVPVEVVAVRRRTAVLEEDLVVAPGQHLAEVAIVGLARDLDERRARTPRALEAADDVPRLRLDQLEVRRAVVSVGAEDREQVREPGHADDFIGLEAVLVPPLLEVDATDAAYRVRRHVAGVEDLEPGREHHDVDGVLDSVGSANPRWRDRLDGARLQLDVLAVERREVLVREPRPLA